MKDLILKRPHLSSRPEEPEHLEDFYPDGDGEDEEDGEDEGYIEGFGNFGGSQGIACLRQQRLMGHNY